MHDLETGQLLGGTCRSERGLWFLKDLSYSHPPWCEELERAIDPYAATLASFARVGLEFAQLLEQLPGPHALQGEEAFGGARSQHPVVTIEEEHVIETGKEWETTVVRAGDTISNNSIYRRGSF